MASGPITSWQIDRETMEKVTDFILGGSKITADGDCSHEIKTLAPWKKSCDQHRQHIKKQRCYFVDIVLSLHFNMLSKEQASLNFMAVVTICSDFGA